jgi:excisionase family DNA binding protein
MQNLLTTQQAAEALGISQKGVLKAIERGTLKAQKFGSERRGVYLIERADVERYDRERKIGRPKKGKTDVKNK